VGDNRQLNISFILLVLATCTVCDDFRALGVFPNDYYDLRINMMTYRLLKRRSPSYLFDRFQRARSTRTMNLIMPRYNTTQRSSSERSVWTIQGINSVRVFGSFSLLRYFFGKNFLSLQVLSGILDTNFGLFLTFEAFKVLNILYLGKLYTYLFALMFRLFFMIEG
jgi:hypothetical protein